MPSSKEYLDFILEQLSELGLNIIQSDIDGGIYDDKLLWKPVKSAVSLISNATYEFPYEWAKETLLVDDVDDRDFLAKILTYV